MIDNNPNGIHLPKSAIVNKLGLSGVRVTLHYLPLRKWYVVTTTPTLIDRLKSVGWFVVALPLMFIFFGLVDCVKLYESLKQSLRVHQKEFGFDSPEFNVLDKLYKEFNV